MSYLIKLTVIEETDEMTSYGPKKRKDTVIDLGDDSQVMDPYVLASLLRGVADRISAQPKNHGYLINGGSITTSNINADRIR